MVGFVPFDHLKIKMAAKKKPSCNLSPPISRNLEKCLFFIIP